MAVSGRKRLWNIDTKDFQLHEQVPMLRNLLFRDRGSFLI